MYEEVLMQFNALPPGAKFMVLSFISLIAARLFQQFSLKFLKGSFRSWNAMGGIVYEELHRPIYMTIAMVGIYFSIGQAGFMESTVQSMERYLITLATLIWAYAINMIGDRILEYVKDSEQSRFDYEFAPIFGNIWTSIIVIITGFWVVSGIWNINLTPFLASAGILGVVGGLAAKDTIANFFGGLALYFDNTYKMGDFIELGSGEKGIVVDIGIRSTTLKTRDDSLITVPNSVLNSAKVINQSAPDKTSRMTVEVNVSYEEDMDEVEDALVEAAENEPSVLEHPQPRVRFREFAADGVRYELFAWIPNPIERIRTQHRLNRAVFESFRDRGIEVPYPQRTLHFSDKRDDDSEIPDMSGKKDEE